MRKKRVTFLYSSLNGFVLSTARAVLNTGRCECIEVVHWPFGSTSGNSYAPENGPGLTLTDRKGLGVREIVRILEEGSPDIIYISGWMDEGYLSAIRQYRSRRPSSAITVCGIDDQWLGTIRQWVGRYYFRLRLRSLFDRMWVSGAPQYYYARQFGYEDRHILYNLLSADRGGFRACAGITRRFVYVGRFEPEKGLNLLLEAYGRLPSSVREVWPLVLIGDGSLARSLKKIAPAGVSFLPFLQPSELAQELSKGGVGCHAAVREPWGVSIHELVMIGYPMIVPDTCGSASEFVIHEFNGLVFRACNVEALENALLRASQMTDEELAAFGKASIKLGSRITPESVAHNLLSADAEWRR